MKVSDFIIDFLIKKGVTDLFGYPGGVICHFLDSAYKYKNEIHTHVAYHEQGAAFEACGYARTKKTIGVAYATSGPGALNLVTGIANAYFDGLPVLFFTGQVDTYASKKNYSIRQCGFQETDIVSVTSTITKKSIYIDSAEHLPEQLENAYQIAISDHPGPVVIDLPADIQRTDIPDQIVEEFYSRLQKQIPPLKPSVSEAASQIMKMIYNSKKPCIIAGAGIIQSGTENLLRLFGEKTNIPIVLSMNAMGLLPYSHKCQFGFIGANGHRSANHIMAKSDLLISLGARLDLKQVGNNRNNFLQNAILIRVDIDAGELTYKVRENEIQFCVDLKDLMPYMLKQVNNTFPDKWLKQCHELKVLLYKQDYDIYHNFIWEISKKIPDGYNIVTDCGQNQVWVLQALKIKTEQNIHTTGGLGTMGYSLPAAIGMYYGNLMPTIAFMGDGGFQMNIQELQFLVRENIPIKLVILNNHSLGMIRQFQEINFEKRYYQTTSISGYTNPNICDLANGYHISYKALDSIDEITHIDFTTSYPEIIEINLPAETYLYPRFGRINGFSDSEPKLPQELEKRIKNI